MLEAWLRIAGILIHSPHSRSEACRRGRSRTRRPCNRCGLWPIGGPTACNMWKQEGMPRIGEILAMDFTSLPTTGFLAKSSLSRMNRFIQYY